jgi:Holliday junction resolvase
LIRGIRDERELVNRLWKYGFAVLRSPASGSATKFPRPDIIAGNSELRLQLAIEVKTAWGKTIYISKESFDQLTAFAKLFGCQPVFALKFKGQRKHPWIIISPKKLKATDQGNYKVTLRSALLTGIDLENFVKGRKNP